jgi:hypothetical protein
MRWGDCCKTSHVRREAFVRRLTNICLFTFVFTACAIGVASSEVASAAELDSASGTSSVPQEIKPLVTEISKNYRCTDKYSDLQSGANAYAIGNCKEGQELEGVVRRPFEESEPNLYSIGGWVGGNFQRCSWIEDPKFKPTELNSKPKNTCSQIAKSPYEIPTSEFAESPISKNNNNLIDGVEVVNPVPCKEYANYRPWSSNNQETELIRELPAYAAVLSGSETPALLWRYVTKYESKDGTGQYVMVHDARISVGEGGWVFAPRSCLPSNLPKGEGEKLPPKPTVTTTDVSGVTTTQATLNGTVNPNGIEATYHFEYGTSTSYESSTYPGDAGTGKVTEPESYSIAGLQPGTTYDYRIVASSGTGTS